MALFVLNVAGMVTYTCATYRLMFHSDAAGKNLFAQQMLAAGSLLPRDWAYVNGDLIVFGGHLLIAPLLLLFPNGFALHAAATTVFAALVLASVWWLGALLGLTTVARLLLLCLWSSGISPAFTENVYGQSAYGPVVVLMLLQAALAAAAYRWRDARTSRYRLALAALAGVAFVGFFGNPARGAVTYALPLAAATATVALARNDAREGNVARRWLDGPLSRGIGAYVLGALLGSAAYFYAIHDRLNISGNAKRHFLPFAALDDRLSLTVKSLFFMFGVDAPPGASVTSAAGIEVLARLVLLGAVLICPVLLATRAKPTADKQLMHRGLANAFLVTLLVLVFLYLLTDLAENVASSRYFIPAFGVALIALVAYIDNEFARGSRSVWLIATALSALIVSATGYRSFFLPLRDYYASAGPDARLNDNRRDRLVGFLRDNGLSFGYASYWNANVSTVLSAGSVVVRPVIVGEVPRPMIHISSTRWYEPSAHEGTTFLLLTADEAKHLNLARLATTAGAPTRTLEFEGYTILVFDRNFAETQFAWDLNLGRPSSLTVDPYTPHQIGRYGAESGWLEARGGEVGALMYGPYISLAAGRYAATFQVAGCDSSKSVLGKADVSQTSPQGANVLGESQLALNDASQSVVVPFQLARAATGLEFRVFSNGSGCLRVRGLTVQRTDNTMQRQ